MSTQPEIRIIDGRVPVDDLAVLLFEIIAGAKRPPGMTAAQALATLPADDAARARKAGKLVASMIEQALAYNAMPEVRRG